jgi:Tfp pilus assembly protein PilZ
LGIRVGKAGRDRRQAFRRNTRNLVMLDDSRVTNISNLIDISETGAQVTSPKPMRKNKIVHLKINLAEKNRQIEVTGKVVWIRTGSGKSPLYRVGVVFVEINKEAWQTLHDYIEEEKAA